MIDLKVKCQSVVASTPKFAHGDYRNAGADIFAAQNKIIWPKSKAIIHTYICVEPQLKPVYFERTPSWFKKFMEHNFKIGMFVKSRSGLSAHYSLEHGAGVIDEGYRGEVKIILYNYGWLPFKIQAGDRVAQLITQLLPMTDIVKAKNLSSSERGDKGFGSSGN